LAYFNLSKIKIIKVNSMIFIKDRMLECLDSYGSQKPECKNENVKELKKQQRRKK